MPQLLRLASFLVFLILGFRVLRAGAGETRRRRVNLLLGYVLVLNGLAGILQWDDWPFTSHTIAVGRARSDRTICLTEFAGVDEAGREWRLDPYTWTPLFDSILQFWCERNLQRLSEPQRARVLGFLLEKAETRRRRLAEGKRIGHERLLGRFGAPYWLLLPRAEAVLPEPLRGLRVYSACWVPEERFLDPTRLTRRLVVEHRR